MGATARFVALCGASLLPLACGGSSQPAQAPAPVATTTAPPVMVEAQPQLSAVAEPEGVFAVARWESPAATLTTFQQWFGVPIPLDEALADVFRTEGAASVVVTDSPVDFVASLTADASDKNLEPLVAFSVGIKSVNEARQVFGERGELREVESGVYRMNIGSRRRGLTCYLGHAMGTAPGRLVCGPAERDLQALYPFMARGMPVAKVSDNDFHAEVRFEPLQKRYGHMLPGILQMGSSFASHELGTDNRDLNRAITDVMTGLSDEALALVNDLQHLTIDASLDQAGQTMSASMQLAFKGRTSWTAQRMMERSGAAGPAPEMFWQLPSKSDNAFFDRGGDPRAYAGIQRTGGDLIRALLVSEDMKAADAKAVAGLFERLFDSAPVTVSGSGHPPQAKAPAAENDFDRVRSTLSASLGWQVMGVQEPSVRYDRWLTDFAAAYRRPAVQRWLREKADLSARAMPRVTYGAKRLTGLPNAKALEISIPPALVEEVSGELPKGQNVKPISYFIVLVPDGTRTWMGFGMDLEQIQQHLAVVARPAAAPDSLQGRAGLDGLKSDRSLSGGFTTIAGIGGQAAGDVVEALEGRPSGDMARIFDALAKMPNHGETPILVTTKVQPGTPAVYSARMVVQKGTVDDLRSLLMSVAGAQMVR